MLYTSKRQSVVFCEPDYAPAHFANILFYYNGMSGGIERKRKKERARPHVKTGFARFEAGPSINKIKFICKNFRFGVHFSIVYPLICGVCEYFYLSRSNGDIIGSISVGV